MKTRRHHNNKGFRAIRRGKMPVQLARIVRKLGIKLEKEVTVKNPKISGELLVRAVNLMRARNIKKEDALVEFDGDAEMIHIWDIHNGVSLAKIDY